MHALRQAPAICRALTLRPPALPHAAESSVEVWKTLRARWFFWGRPNGRPSFTAPPEHAR